MMMKRGACAARIAASDALPLTLGIRTRTMAKDNDTDEAIARLAKLVASDSDRLASNFLKTGGFKGQNILELTECHNFIAACELAQRLALGVA